jgi:hypothetical protein
MNIRGTALAIVLITSATVIAGCHTTPSSPVWPSRSVKTGRCRFETVN